MFPAWVARFANERTIAWILLWSALVVSIAILALQIALPGTE